jgi:uncharacterized protein YjeT (DUF2065 family)
MSITALILVLFGLSIMVSRAPLLVAPEATRNTYLNLFNTPGRMRVLGLAFAIVFALILWAVWGIPDLASQIVRYVAGFVLILALLAMIPVPAFASRLAVKVWMAFPPPMLRVMGLFAVIVGGLIVWYGFSL